jgi:succinyl-diaminopimelate desuccinylase
LIESSPLTLAQDAGDQLVELCAQLVRIPSPNPPGDTRAIAAFVRQYLAGEGLEVQGYTPDPGRPNLVAEVQGSDGGPHLVLNSHLDTFPPAEGNADPYAGRVSQGRVYGCGVCDMKAGVAISLVLAGALARAAGTMRGKVSLTYSSDEETGGNLGTAWLLANVPGLRDADACFVLDQSGSELIAVGEKGPCWLRIRTSGGGGHAAYGQHLNAIERLMVALQPVLELRRLEIGAAAETRAQSPEARAVTVNIGRIEGGVSPNLIATSALADVDIRVPVGGDCRWIIGRVREAIRASGVDCEVDVLMASDPTLTDPASDFVQLLRQEAEQVLGRTLHPAVRVGASDARLFRAAGVPTVVYGPAPRNMGTRDEYVEIDELRTIARIYARTLAHLTGRR